MTAEQPIGGRTQVLVAGISSRVTIPGPILDAFGRVDRGDFLESVYVPVMEVFTRAREGLRLDDWAEVTPEQHSTWISVVYSGDPVVTKIDEAGNPSVSSTAPWLMATMLRELNLSEGQRVLEVGTGTGYNAAVIAELIGPSGVLITVEVDPSAADAAARRLADSKLVTVVTASALEWRSSRAFDRIVVTADIRELPRSWLEQLDKDGVLVTNFTGPLCSVLLHIQRRGDRLELRAADCPEVGFVVLVGAGAAGEERSVEDIQDLLRMPNPGMDPLQLPAGLNTILSGASRDFRFFCQLQRPSWRIAQFQLPHTGDAQITVVYDEWVTTSIWLRENDVWTSYRGDQSLADDLFELYDLWLKLGRPSYLEPRLTIDRSGDTTMTIGDYRSRAHLAGR